MNSSQRLDLVPYTLIRKLSVVKAKSHIRFTCVT